MQLMLDPSPSQRHTIRRTTSDQQGFTLVELLVAVVILLVLLTITISTFNYSANADRVRSGARQIQSFMAGARDKAIYARDVRGIRLLLDPNDNHTASAMQYIGASKRQIGTITFDPSLTADQTGTTAVLTPAAYWSGLYRRGLFGIGSQLQIPNNTGNRYIVSYMPAPAVTGPVTVVLNRPNKDLAGSNVVIDFSAELFPGPIEDSQPVLLPKGVVVDLDGSNVPMSWRPSTMGGAYLATMDILFSPRGEVVGNSVGLGMLHLHVAEIPDVVTWHANVTGRSISSFVTGNLPLVPVDPPSAQPTLVKRDRIIVTLSTRTGNVSVHQVNPTDVVVNATKASGSDQLADDPFAFAETGQVANK